MARVNILRRVRTKTGWRNIALDRNSKGRIKWLRQRRSPSNGVNLAGVCARLRLGPRLLRASPLVLLNAHDAFNAMRRRCCEKTLCHADFRGLVT